MTYLALLDNLQLTKSEYSHAARNIERSSRDLADTIDNLPDLLVAFQSHFKVASYLKLVVKFEITPNNPN